MTGFHLPQGLGNAGDPVGSLQLLELMIHCLYGPQARQAWTQSGHGLGNLGTYLKGHAEGGILCNPDWPPT